MKTFVLTLLLIASVNFTYAQDRPCVASYRLNNGGGNCPDINGIQATGSVTLTFVSPLTPGFIPAIVRVDSMPGGTVPDVFFGPGTLNNNGTVTYCYYLGPNNTNNLQGHNEAYNFVIFYSINGQPVPCGENSSLPVNFKSFTAVRNRSAVVVKWETVTEQNNSGFALERNTNGSWLQIGFVPSGAANGNSNTILSYQFTDMNDTKGITQYRIKQIDFDAKSKYSEIRSVRGEGQSTKSVVYPSPSFDGRVTVVFDDKAGNRDAMLMDFNGRIISQWKNFAGNTIQIDNLKPGIYMLRTIIAGTRENTVDKIVVTGGK